MNAMFAMQANVAMTHPTGLIGNLFDLLIFGICVLIIWFIGTWVLGKFGAPPMAKTCWDGLFMLLGAVVIINFLLSLAGHGFISW